jgi:predicted transcriptional regulator
MRRNSIENDNRNYDNNTLTNADHQAVIDYVKKNDCNLVEAIQKTAQTEAKRRALLRYYADN